MIDARDCIAIGAPGGLAFWTFEVLRALAKLTPTGSVVVQQIERAESVAPRKSGSERRILLCHYPSDEIIAAISSASLRTLYLREVPSLTVAHLMETTGRTLIEAVRVCTASYVGALVMRSCGDAMVLDRDADETVLGILRHLCEHFGLRPDAATLANYAGHVAPEANLEAALTRFLPSASRSRLNILDASQFEVVHAVLEPLADIDERAIPTRPIVWPGSILYSAERPTQLAGPFLDLTGPARMLYHGPFLHLPPATYDAEFVVACKDVSRDSTFRIEVHAGETCLTRVRFDLAGEGGFEGRFAFAHTQSLTEVQVQLIAERGAIEGELALVQLALMPRAS